MSMKQKKKLKLFIFIGLRNKSEKNMCTRSICCGRFDCECSPRRLENLLTNASRCWYEYGALCVVTLGDSLDDRESSSSVWMFSHPKSTRREWDTMWETESLMKRKVKMLEIFTLSLTKWEGMEEEFEVFISCLRCCLLAFFVCQEAFDGKLKCN